MVLKRTSYSELHRLLDRMEKRVMGLQDWSLWPRPVWDGPPLTEVLAYGPTFHVTENAESFSIEAAMPGFDRNDLKVSVKDGCIEVVGRKQDEQSQERGSSFWVRRQEAFSHTLRLPWYVNTKSANAQFKGGVLTISLPKRGMPGSRIIPIQGTESKVEEVIAGFVERIKKRLNFLLWKLRAR